MRVVVVGRQGQLGSAFMTAFADLEPVGLERRLLDIEAPSAVSAMLALHRPDLVINTAAFHDVELCEARPDRAFAVNALAIDGLAAQCAVAGAALLHVSTDYVFDGTATTPYRETDAPNPVSAYGISKYAGELSIRRHLAEAYIVRTSGLYGGRGGTSKGMPFIERILAQASAGAPIRVVTDVTFSPSFTRHVAAAVRQIVDRTAYGTYHVTNGGFCTWHEFAEDILRQARIEAPVARVGSEAFPGTTRRPKFSALAHGALDRLGIPAMPGWQDGIRDYLSERDHASISAAAARP